MNRHYLNACFFQFLWSKSKNLFIFFLLIIKTSQIFPSCALDIKEPESFLKKYLKGVFEIKKTLTSFSNDNLVIREVSSDDEWVLRVPNEISNYLSNRKQEYEILRWARQEKLSLIEVRASDLEKGYLLTRFLPGQSCSAQDFKDTFLLQNALELLSHLHSSKTVPISTKFQPLNRYLVTSNFAAKNGFLLPKEVREIAAQLKEFLLQVPISHFLLVPCHNDPSPQNFFLQNGSLYLHDWELAGFNDPLWDLTHFSVLADVDHERVLDFYSTSDPLASEKIVFFKPFIFFNSLVWASLERKCQCSSLPLETTEMLYHNFLKKITDCIQSQSFQNSFKKLIQGGHL